MTSSLVFSKRMSNDELLSKDEEHRQTCTKMKITQLILEDFSSAIVAMHVSVNRSNTLSRRCRGLHGPLATATLLIRIKMLKWVY